MMGIAEPVMLAYVVDWRSKARREPNFNEKNNSIVWWMRPIYKLFFATPCKHPNFWGESQVWYTMAILANSCY